MRKAIVAGALSLVAALSLGACTGGSATSGGSGSTSLVEEEVEAEAGEELEEEVEETEETEETEDEAGTEATAEAEEETQLSWTIKNGTDMGISVSGDAYSVTLTCTTSSLYDDVFYNSVTIGDETYNLNDGSVNGYEGCPLVSTVNGKEYDYFVGMIEATEDETTTVTYTMADGSELPTSIVMNCDESMTENDAWSGGTKVYTYESVTLTLSYK